MRCCDFCLIDDILLVALSVQRAGSFVAAIDPFKVNDAIFPGVQTYWGERAAKYELQMATRLSSLLPCQITLVVR